MKHRLFVHIFEYLEKILAGKLELQLFCNRRLAPRGSRAAQLLRHCTRSIESH